MNRLSTPPTADTRRRMRATRQRDTPAEIALRRALHAQGLRFRVDYPVLGRRRADVAFPRHRIAVFVDGCFWHGCPLHGTAPKSNSDWWRDKLEANKRRDEDTNRRLTEQGWTVVRSWEHEDSATTAARIGKLIGAAPGAK